MSADPEAPQGTPGDTPAPATDEGGAQPPESQVNWEERYQHLQPEYTRATQEAAQYRQLVSDLRADDPDTRLRAAQALGLELVAEEDDDDLAPQYDDDPAAAMRAELDEIKQTLAQRDQQAQEAQRLEQIETYVEQQLDAIQGLKDRQKDWIVNRAVHLPPTSDGMPDIQAAHQEYVELMNEEMQSWAKPKRSAPHVNPTGTAGTQVPDLDNRAQRVAWMTEQLQADQQ